VAGLVFGALQYRWIDAVSQAQETRTKARLCEAVRLISDALDTEITRAALAFTIPPSPAVSMYDQLERTWAAWNHDAPWPRIVSGVSFLESNEGGWHTHSLGDSRAFDLGSIPHAAMLVDSPPEFPGSVVRAEARNLDLSIDGQPYLLRPLPTFSATPGTPQMNWVVIRYNLSYLSDAVFPRLLEKYSSAEDRLEFRFQLEPKGTPILGAIMVADQFHDRPDCLMPYSIGVGVVSVARLAGKPRGRFPRAGGMASQFTVGQWLPLNSLLHAAGHCQLPPHSSSPGLMQISVRRPRGALSDVYAGFRRRNELLSVLVLVVLLAALAALVISTERARRLARLQTLVAAGISHELRTPLASLSVAADDLKSGHVETVEQARRYGEIIDAQLRRLRQVVDQALALTKLSQSNRATCLSSLSVSEIVNAAIDAMAPRLSEAGMQIERQIAPDVPRMLADPHLLLRCLTNLIENSIKYAGSGRWILLSARPTHASRRLAVEVAVEDRGPGIRNDEVAAVFEPFYRGESARQTRQPGSGLGLAIVRSAVEANGGRIRLERAVPRGCRFRLVFPAVDPAGVHSKQPEFPG
jgi:signal transduction histidine kinase